MITAFLTLVLACGDRGSVATRGGEGDSLKHQSASSAAPVLSEDGSEMALYFGTTGNSAGRIARILALGPGPRGGRLYIPGAAGELCDVAVEGDSLRWSTMPGGSAVIAFAGRLTRNGLTGRLRVISQRGAELRSDSVDLERVAVWGLRPKYAGVYSDFTYGEESGDLSGNELVLIPTGDRVVGSLSVAQGEPSAPYALEHVRFRGDTLIFEIPALSGVAEYKVFPSGSALALGAPGRAPKVLTKKGSLQEHFASKGGEDCSGQEHP